MMQAILKVKVIWGSLRNGATIARTGPSAPTKSNFAILSKHKLQQRTLHIPFSSIYVYRKLCQLSVHYEEHFSSHLSHLHPLNARRPARPSPLCLTALDLLHPPTKHFQALGRDPSRVPSTVRRKQPPRLLRNLANTPRRPHPPPRPQSQQYRRRPPNSNP